MDIEKVATYRNLVGDVISKTDNFLSTLRVGEWISLTNGTNTTKYIIKITSLNHLYTRNLAYDTNIDGSGVKVTLNNGTITKVDYSNAYTIQKAMTKNNIVLSDDWVFATATPSDAEAAINAIRMNS